MENYIVKLKDGYIKSLDTDEESHSGCPTCDYGSSYINEFWITLSKSKIYASTNQMYEHCFYTGEVMTCFLRKAPDFLNMTENDFIDWFKSFIFEKDDDAEFKVSSI